MTYYIHIQTNRVVEAKTRKEAKKLLGLSFTQMANELNLFDPHSDKEAIIPQELEIGIADYKERKSV